MSNQDSLLLSMTGDVAMPSLPPLPLTPFERYMVADDQPGYPMVAIMELEFGGRLDTDLLAAALQRVVPSHPLMVARLERQGETFVWNASLPWQVSDLLQIEGDAGTVPGVAPAGHIDLTRSQGLKLRVRHSGESTRISFLLHHAVADGFGVLAFMADWLGQYDRLVKQQPEETRTPAWTVEALIDRGHSRWIIAEPITRWQALRSFAIETMRWLLRRPQPLRMATTTKEEQQAWPELLSVTLSVEETQQLRKRADAGQVTVNDLLLRDLFVAVARWQGNGKLLKRWRWLRINVPTSLRLLGEAPLPSCNVLGYVFLTHREAECAAPSALLKTVAREMAGVRRWNLGQFFLDGLVSAERLPGVVRWFTSSKQCMATTVFSNMGDVRRFLRKVLERRGRYYYAGEAPLLKITAAPPVRPGTHAVFLAATCGDELTISFRAHPGKLRSSEQAKLLAMFMQEIRASLSGEKSDAR